MGHLGCADRRRRRRALVRPLPCLLVARKRLGEWYELCGTDCYPCCCRRAERTRWGKELSAPLLATLFGLALSNLNIVPAEAPHVYGLISTYLLPLAVPLLLFAADLRCAWGFTSAVRGKGTP